MQFHPTSILDVMAVETGGFRDERGAFARIYCPQEFSAAGIDFAPVQTNVAISRCKHTLRGMHYQSEPHGEMKLLTLVHGETFNVAIDMRKNSPTYRKWVGMHLSSEKLDGILVPCGFANGYITLSDEVILFYHTSAMYAPDYEKGVRWDDPTIGVKWPCQPALVSDKDQNWSLLSR